MKNLYPAAVWLLLSASAVADEPEDAQQSSMPRESQEVQAVIEQVDQLCRQRTVYMIGPEKAKRLADLVRQKKPQLVVECGTAIGYSGLWIARELKTAGQGKLVTIEIDPQRAREAEENFKRAGLAKVVEVRVGDVRELVKEIRGPVDFLFIDCNFANYYPCFTGIEDKLADGAGGG